MAELENWPRTAMQKNPAEAGLSEHSDERVQ